MRKISPRPTYYIDDREDDNLFLIKIPSLWTCHNELESNIDALDKHVDSFTKLLEKN